MSDQAKATYSFLYENTRQMFNWLVPFINLTFKCLFDHSIIVFEDQSWCKKSPYLELFWSAFFPHFPTFGLNTGKSGKNSDQNNSRYGLFLRNEYPFKLLDSIDLSQLALKSLIFFIGASKLIGCEINYVLSEAYLEPSRTSTMELFSSQISDWVLNTPRTIF